MSENPTNHVTLFLSKEEAKRLGSETKTYKSDNVVNADLSFVPGYNAMRSSKTDVSTVISIKQAKFHRKMRAFMKAAFGENKND